MTSGDRILQAREICGLTQEQLATFVGVEQAFISMIERGAREPSPNVLEAIAFRTGFTPQFFQQPPGPEFPAGSLLFRRRKSATSQSLAMFRQTARLAFELHEILSARFKAKPIQIPQLKKPPEQAAQLTRASLGLSPDTPVANLIRHLERSGVVVLPVPLDVDGHDAFSAWVDTEPRKPVIVMSVGKPGDRQRFSDSHELGHLVLHRPPHGDLKRVEEEANEFAGAFLLPEEAARREFTSPLTLSNLAEMKHRWGMSIAALITRAHALELIDDKQRADWMKRLSARRWRKQEPIVIPEEKPRLLLKMAEMAFGNPPDLGRMASAVKSSPSRIELLLSLYASGNSGGVNRKLFASVDDAGPLLRFPESIGKTRSSSD